MSAFDPDGDDVTVTMDSGPRGATFDGDVFKWTPTNRESLNISYVFCYLYSHNKLHCNVIDIRYYYLKKTISVTRSLEDYCLSENNQII